MIDRITKLFPLWAVIFSLLAFFYDGLFSGLKSWIVPLLTVVMFGMGMTLTWDNFKQVLKAPSLIILGFSLQYLIMPGAAYIISTALNLPPALMTGMVLVGSSPGGTASNVITYLGKGNVALSITLTLTSTICAVGLTPLLTLLLLNHVVPVPAIEMLFDILQIVLIPVLLGTGINSFFGKRMGSTRDVFPLLSTLAIVLIIAIVVALNKTKFSEVGSIIIAAVILHNLIGLTIGYYIPKFLKCSERDCRTISIEVGMQNSGLAVALAVKYFSAAAALPGAIFSVWHNLSGSFIAGWWRQKDSKKTT